APRSLTSPRVGFRSPHISFRSVVLPAPFGPKIVTNSPGPTARSTSATAVIAPKDRLSFRVSIAGSGAIGLPAPARGDPARVEALQDRDGLGGQPLPGLLEVLLRELADPVLHLEILDGGQGRAPGLEEVVPLRRREIVPLSLGVAPPEEGREDVERGGG